MYIQDERTAVVLGAQRFAGGFAVIVSMLNRLRGRRLDMKVARSREIVFDRQNTTVGRRTITWQEQPTRSA
jgi:hypothetical protein